MFKLVKVKTVVKLSIQRRIPEKSAIRVDFKENPRNLPGRIQFIIPQTKFILFFTYDSPRKKYVTE